MDLVDKNVAAKQQWNVSLVSGYTLHRNASVAYRYASGFAFVHRERTRDVDNNIGWRRDEASLGVSLTNIHVLVATTMSNCSTSDMGQCTHSS